MKVRNHSLRLSPRVLIRGPFFLGGNPPVDPSDPASPDGRAKVLNQPSTVRIRVLDRRTLAMVDDVRSAPDGTWRVQCLDDREYLVLGLDENGRVNGAIQDRVRPARMGGGVSTGLHVGLNLGPLVVAPGARVALNLGVEWDAEPVEPVIRGLSRGVAMPWHAARRRQLERVASWGRSIPIKAETSTGWDAAPVVAVLVTIGWGLSSSVRSACYLQWNAQSALVHAGRSLRWGSQARVGRGGRVPWRTALRQAEVDVRLSWRELGTASAVATTPWISTSPVQRAARKLAWLHPALSRRHAQLPWQSAGKLAWYQGPRPTPDPDPDPDGPVISGARIALQLGCGLMPPGLAPLNLGITACYAVRPQQRTYIVINTASVVRLPDRTPIEVSRVSINSSVDAWGHSFDLELANPAHAALLMPTAAGPRQIEVALNGYVWTALVESQARRREWGSTAVTLTGRSRTALLAAPYAPARVKATTEERSMAQLVAEELADTGYAASYDTADWVVPAGAWFYDGLTALDAVSALADAGGAVVQSDPSSSSLRVRARYPSSPWRWRNVPPDHVLQEDYVVTESVQMRSAPLYDAVVVTGELAGKGVTAKVRKDGEAGQLFAPQASSPLISTAAAAAERGRNILSDRGEQALIELSLPLFAAPLRAGEVGRILPLDLVQLSGADGTWHGLCTASRVEVRADDAVLVVEQIITLERHYTDAD